MLLYALPRAVDKESADAYMVRLTYTFDYAQSAINRMKSKVRMGETSPKGYEYILVMKQGRNSNARLHILLQKFE
jgi:hypothetical protein